MSGRDRASEHNERGRELDAQGRRAEAIREYERACALDPGWSVPHYNLGLIYKYAGDWERSLHRNQRAAALNPSDQASWWNLGIAATALGRWDEARRAWRGCGIDLPEGEGPVDYPCGRTPIRLHPQGDAEVVWSQRIDPARAAIQSIPFPESGFRWGDLVLNDGAPTGYRMLGEQEVPVFDCLGMLKSSPFSTFVAQIERPGQGEAAGGLAELAAARGLAAEDWTTSVAVLCKACSEGRPHGRHDHSPGAATGAHRVAIAARGIHEAERLLADWRRQDPSVHVLSVGIVLDAGETIGKA